MSGAEWCSSKMCNVDSRGELLEVFNVLGARIKQRIPVIFL